MSGSFRIAASYDRNVMLYRVIHPILALTTLSIACACLAGCEPVPPPMRGKLAHPTMTASEMTNGLDNHVRAVSEGAVGGLAGAGGGCGCN